MIKMSGSGKNSMKKYDSFKLTDNSKVRFRKDHNNTFSLSSGLPVHGGTCVDATEGPGGCVGKCYDVNMRKLYKNYKTKEDYNTSLVWKQTHDRHLQIISNTISKWLLNGGTDKPYFRIHTGGEFFSDAYAIAWRKAILFYPEVKFWAYTRAMFAVPYLAGLPNLTLMLSCDPVNKDRMLAVYARYKHLDNVAVAWMGNELPKDIPNDRALLVCPAVTGKMSKQKEIGACARCRACIDRPLKSGKVRHIQFPIHK